MSKQGGIKAGAAYVELSMRDKTSQGLRDAQKRMELFSARVKEIGSAVAMAGAAVTAFGGAIVGAIGAGVAAFAKIAGDFSDLAAQTGLSAELMSELEMALKDAGSSVEDFAASVVKMRKFLYEASTGSKSAAEAMAALGLNAADLIDLSADQQFLRIADALSKVRNPTERTALAMELFGKSAYKMLPLLEAGGAGIEEFRRKARELGFSISGETADAADALGTQIEVLQDQFKRVAVAIGEAVLPVAQAFVATMQNLVGGVVAFIRENQGMVVGALAAGAALLAVGTAVGVVGAAIVGVGALVASVGTIVGALATAVGALLTPVGAIIAAVTVAAGVAIYASGAFGTLWEAGVRSAGAVRDAWAGITDAISASDYQLAGRIAMQALEVAVQEGLGALRVAFSELFGWIVTSWATNIRSMVSVAMPLFSLFDEFTFGIGDKIEKAIADSMESLIDARRELEGEAVAPLRKQLDDMIEQARRVRAARPAPEPSSVPQFVEPTMPDIVAPAMPAAPVVAAPALPDLAPAQAEIQARMSAMGGFNATALNGLFGDSTSRIEEHTKKSAEYLSKLLEQGKRNRESLVWS